MNEHEFDKMDSEFLEKFEKLRKKKVPKRVLDGFSASVEEKIRKKLFTPGPEKKRFRLPIWAPVLTVLVLSTLVVFRTGLDRPVFFKAPSLTQKAPQANLTNGDLTVEVAALRELGEWTDEDESAVGPDADEALQVIEMGWS